MIFIFLVSYLCGLDDVFLVSGSYKSGIEEE